MSLVGYGNSDESENEEEINEQPEINTEIQDVKSKDVNKNSKLQLPNPKTEQVHCLNYTNGNKEEEEGQLNFDVIPELRPNKLEHESAIKDTDSAPLPKKVHYTDIEKLPKKERGPARITIPSLSEFKDLEEETGSIHAKRTPSRKASGLLSAIPPAKNSIVTTKTNSMVPHVLTKKPDPEAVKRVSKPVTQAKCTATITSRTLKSLSNYNASDSDSDSEDDKVSSSKVDFFSLSTPTKIPDELLVPMSTSNIAALSSSSTFDSTVENAKTLVSNVINLPKEEILLKNKTEVGPKLPVPEQEYNIDSQGNVAFDEKAIEYLCGKRGVKRKNELSNVNIVEISGEDIKPDEREWMVKALTEEPIQRPISINAGPGGQSKKKHQITYLAHQAKAMELELKNQWAQNKASRQQTRSKYGF